jgi:hypothetical protein
VIARDQAAGVVQGVLDRAYHRLAERVADLEAQLCDDPAVWGRLLRRRARAHLNRASTGAGRVPHHSDDGSAPRLEHETLLKHKKVGAAGCAAGTGQ